MEFQAAHNQALKDKTQVGRQGMMLQLHISVIDHSWAAVQVKHGFLGPCQFVF